jgi:hypothetical protein
MRWRTIAIEPQGATHNIWCYQHVEGSPYLWKTLSLALVLISREATMGGHSISWPSRLGTRYGDIHDQRLDG